jgi:hypothetical protein
MEQQNNSVTSAETKDDSSINVDVTTSRPNNAKPYVTCRWNEWMSAYPKNNGLYIVVMRKNKEVWVAYWNDAMRRFEEACPEFTDKGVDVDFWAEMPVAPNGR